MAPPHPPPPPLSFKWLFKSNSTLGSQLAYLLYNYKWGVGNVEFAVWSGIWCLPLPASAHQHCVLLSVKWGRWSRLGKVGQIFHGCSMRRGSLKWIGRIIWLFASNRALHLICWQEKCMCKGMQICQGDFQGEFCSDIGCIPLSSTCTLCLCEWFDEQFNGDLVFHPTHDWVL